MTFPKAYPKELADYILQVKQEHPHASMLSISRIVNSNKDVLAKFGLVKVSYSYCNYIAKPEVYERLYATAEERKQLEAEKRRQRALERLEIKEEKKMRKKRLSGGLLYIIMPIFDKEICSSQYLSDKILEKYGRRVTQQRIENSIQTLESELRDNSPIILASQNKIEGALYKLNKKSPYWGLCDGFAKETA
jgi:hypothetical protein